MTKIRAKMTVQTVTKNNANQEIVTLGCIYSGSSEDNTFAKSTPSGSLTLTIDNPAAQGQLTAGAAVYVDLVPVASL